VLANGVKNRSVDVVAGHADELLATLFVGSSAETWTHAVAR
jgi:hypothetical protein